MNGQIGDLIDFATFSSVWYWIFIALAWSSRSHWTIGIPFDAVIRAEKRGGTWESDLDAMAHAMSARFALFMGRGGPWIIGVATFVVTGLIATGIATRNEMVLGIAAFAVPMILAEAGDVRLALRIHATGLRGYDLRRALVWRRFLNQVTGLVSLLLAAACAVLVLLTRHGVLPPS